MKMIKTFLSILAAFVFIACNEDTNQRSEKESIEAPFINPTFTNFDIPFADYKVQAETGDTLSSESGSIIIFPPNAFVDKDGNIVGGEVTITYREISNPIDMFIAGIPMDYDSAGTSYTFESAGMCEIYATKDDVALFVNPDSKPEVHLVSKNNSDGFSIYALDTIQRNWINKGVALVTEIDTKSLTTQTNTDEPRVLVPPVKPLKASGNRPLIVIEIVPGSVPELNEYNNLQFEIAEDEENFDPEFSKVEWSDVELVESERRGIYNVTFSKGQKQVSYIVQPVFEGKDYDEALKIFEQKNKKYRELKSARVTEEKVRDEQIKMENQRIEKENERIEKENEEIERENERIKLEIKREKERIKKVNEEIERRKRLTAEMILKEQKRREQEAYVKGGAEMEVQIYRTFQIEQFGIWNCDRPLLQQSIPIMAHFRDKSGKLLHLNLVNVVYMDYNSIFRTAGNEIRLFPDSARHMIFAVMDDKFVYLNEQDFKKYKINSTTKEMEFTMKIHPDKITSNEDIKRIVGI